MIYPARTSGDRGQVRRHPWAIAGDQHISSQAIRLRRNEFAQPSGAAFLAGFQDQLQIETRRAVTFRQYSFERCQVQRMLPLVVSGSAAVPAVIFLD